MEEPVTEGRQRRVASFREGLGLLFYRMRQSKLSLVGLGIILFIVFLAVFAPWISPYPQDAGPTVHFAQRFLPPSLQHPFGTDDDGRDILTRVIFGSRIALELGLLVIGIAIGIGTPLGILAGIVGGKFETLVMRAADIFLSFPPLALALVVVAIIGAGITHSIIGITIVWWPWYTRIAHGETISLRETQFVEASKLLGASRLRIAFRDVLPNLTTPIIVKGSLDMGFAILVGAALSFFGLGAQPPTPDWGTMMSIGQQYLTSGYWWMTTFPGLFVFITVLGFNLFGDGLRDMLDIRLQ